MESDHQEHAEEGARSWVPLAIALCLGLGLPLTGLWLGGSLLGDRLSRLDSFGLGAWCLHAAATAVLVGGALVPSHAMALVGGFLLGVAPGMASSMVGIVAGAAGGFVLARRWVGEGLRTWLLRGRRRARLQQRLLARGGSRVMATVILIRLSPMFTFAATNVLMASARVSPRAFLFGTAVGIAPRTLIAAWLGAELSRLDLRDPPSVSSLGGLALALLVPVLALVALGVWATRATTDDAPGEHPRSDTDDPEPELSSAAVTDLELRRVFEFEQDEVRWFSVNDDVMGGVSRGGFQQVEDGVGAFLGVLSLENNGGFSTIRSEARDLGLSGFEGLALRVRGDGRTYSLRAVVSDQRSERRSFRAPFTTQAGEWQEIRVPFSDLELSIRGRRFAGKTVDPSMVRSLGFSISDKDEAPFRLEIDWVRAYR